MNNKPIFAILILWLMSATCHARDSSIALTDKAFDKHRDSKGVLLLHVNWGRQWNCHGYENAQLQKLAFQLMPAGEGTSAEEISLDIPSRLFAKSTFQRYALLVSPGEYALSGFRLKLAGSASGLRIYEADAAHLIEGGKPKGGSFRITPGEIVYIGHFGVDCDGEPSPWRFYIEDPADFSRYGAEFHREFPSTGSVPVTFRLFETDTIGKPYSLPAAPADAAH